MRTFWRVLLVTIIVGSAGTFGWLILQRRSIDATQVVVCGEMDEIAHGVERYVKTNHAFPDSLRVLVPVFVPASVAERAPISDLAGRTILVPASPYSIRETSDGFEISCTVHMLGFTQIVRTARGEFQPR